MRILLGASAALLTLAVLSGCTKAHAKTPAGGLDTPAPPDRVIVPVTMADPVELPAATMPPAQPAPPRPRETPAQRPAAATPPPVVVAPPQGPEQPPQPPPVLQTSVNAAVVEQRAKSLIVSAQRDLDRVSPSQLTPNARAQYDTAKGFIRQAEDALKVRNVVLARELADKAAALASQLRK